MKTYVALSAKLVFFFLSFFRFLEESSPPEDILDSEPIQDPWVRNSEFDLERVSRDTIPLTSRDPDGASIDEDRPAVLEAVHEETKAGDLMTSSEDMDVKHARGKKKKKSNVFACFNPVRLTFRKKSERANQSKSDTTKLVEEM